MIFPDNSVPGRELKVDRLGKVALDEGGIEVNGRALELLCNRENEKETDGAPIDDERVGAFLFSEDLKISPNDESCFEFVYLPVGPAFSFKSPGRFDALIARGYV